MGRMILEVEVCVVDAVLWAEVVAVLRREEFLVCSQELQVGGDYELLGGEPGLHERWPVSGGEDEHLHRCLDVDGLVKHLSLENCSQVRLSAGERRESR